MKAELMRPNATLGIAEVATSIGSGFSQARIPGIQNGPTDGLTDVITHAAVLQVHLERKNVAGADNCREASFGLCEDAACPENGHIRWAGTRSKIIEGRPLPVPPS